MAELWYYTNEGKQMDAVSMKELQRLVSDGILKPTDMVWKEGMPRWIRASSVTELYPDPTTALDHFFTGSKHSARVNADAQETASAPSAAAGSSKPAPREEEPAPSVKKRRRSEEGADNRPPTRRKESLQEGSNVGIFVALGLGAFILLTALAVGVIILIAVSRDNPAPPRIAEVPPLQQNPLQPINPNNLVNPKIAYNLPNLFPNVRDVRSVSFRKGTSYAIIVTSKSVFPNPRLPRVEIAVVDSNNQRVATAPAVGPNPKLHWRPQADGEYRVEIANMDPQLSIQVSVVIHEEGAPADQQKEAPLAADVKTGLGSIRLTAFQPGQEHVFKLRVKAGHKAMVRVTNHTKIPGADVNLFVLKDSNGAEIASDVRPDARASVNFTLDATEIVRVRVVNASPTTPSNCTIFYNGG